MNVSTGQTAKPGFSFLRPLNKLQLRRKRALCVSFPKSGRTWLRKILMDLDVNFQFTHADGAFHEERRQVAQEKFMKDFERNLILLYRDPRDVAVSYFHDLSERQKVFDGTLSEMLRHPQFGVGAIAAYNQRWMALGRDFAAFHPIRYEDMKADSVAAIAGLCRFLGLFWISRAAITRVCATSDFASMQRAEASGALASAYSKHWFSTAPGEGGVPKVRRGRVGGFVDEMTTDDIRYCAEVLAQLDYPDSWLCVPREP